MAGHQDRAADIADWAASVMAQLAPVIDQAVAAVTRAEPLAAGDIAGATARARSVGVIARAARSVVALAIPCRRGPHAAPDEAEDEMIDRDDSPENLARIRADLEARLDGLHAVIEAKRMAAVAAGGGIAPAACESVLAA